MSQLQNILSFSIFHKIIACHLVQVLFLVLPIDLFYIITQSAFTFEIHQTSNSRRDASVFFLSVETLFHVLIQHKVSVVPDGQTPDEQLDVWRLQTDGRMDSEEVVWGGIVRHHGDLWRLLQDFTRRLENYQSKSGDLCWLILAKSHSSESQVDTAEADAHSHSHRLKVMWLCLSGDYY